MRIILRILRFVNRHQALSHNKLVPKGFAQRFSPRYQYNPLSCVLLSPLPLDCIFLYLYLLQRSRRRSSASPCWRLTAIGERLIGCPHLPLYALSL